VGAIAGVDDAALSTRERKCAAGRAVTDDDEVGIERFEIAGGVLRVSPFFSEEASAVKLMMSAERRCSESSKLMRVRVEGSTKRLMTVLPRRAGTFLIARSPTA